MSFLRTISTRRLVALALAVVALAAGGTAIAVAAGGGGPVPPAKPLPRALHDALAAPAVDGITARISFTNQLIDSASVQGSDPILTGASGRLWLGAGGRVRLELQSDSGDAQIVSDGKEAWVYDASSNTVYRGRLPQDRAGRAKPADRRRQRVPSVKEIERQLSRLMRHADLSGAIPGDVAGRAAYTVRISPKHDGGLLGAGEVAWDAARGVPLRAAVYAQDKGSPVLELKATDISYGPVPASDFDVKPPSGARVVNVAAPRGSSGAHERGARKPVTGAAAVGQAVRFQLAAPATLVGLPRHEVRLLDWKGSPAALVTYGRNLGGIAVIEQTARSARPSRKARGHGRSADSGARLTLPKVSINGVTGQELDTALGTMVRFERGGVAYTVIGSVPPAAAEAAARGL